MMRDERNAARKAIQFHYDVGNRFYELWLGSRMTYSCAMWPDGKYDDDLDAAQLRKLDYHIDQSGASVANRVLDIGCGWGGLLFRCIERNPKLEQAVGLTLSAEQKSHVDTHRQSHPVDCRLENWLDHHSADPYDAVVSIGAFEHFAAPDDDRNTHLDKYREFFEFCRANLRKNGFLSLQTIAYLNMRREDSNKFMETEIFPNSDLPYLSEIVEASAGVMEITRIRNDRLDYGHTCSLWSSRLKKNLDKAVEASNQETVRRFQKYLQLSAIGFFQAKLSLLRIVARKL